MAAVADRAGVSRQTVYNTFGSRHELAQAYVLREADRFLAAIREPVRERADDPRAALTAALEIFLAAAETNPLVRAISASEEGDELLALVTTRGEPLLGRVTLGLAELIEDTWPAVGERDAALAADTLVRLAISYAALPSGSPADSAEGIGRIAGPFIDEVIGGRA